MVYGFPTVYNSPSVYKTAGGGGNVLLSTLCDNIEDNTDVPLIGPASNDLTEFSYTDLNPGIKLSCNNLPVGYTATKNIYELSSDPLNFYGSLLFSVSRSSSYRAYGFRVGPFYIFVGDGNSVPYSNAVSIMMIGISSSVVVHSNTSYERRSNGQLFVKIDNYTQNRIYDLRFTVDDSVIKVTDIVTGKYFYIDRQYYTVTYSTNIGFGPLSMEKMSEQTGSIYSVVMKAL